MIRTIVKDPMFLSIRAQKAAKDDLPAVQDLVETLRAHHEGCVGMAMNMIGIAKAAIAVDTGKMILVMINPVITKKTGAYQASEGCLSLTGVRQVTRYQKITVTYEDLSFKKHTGEFEGFTAEIIEHECDHLAGILI
jgi:peptide deformylase